ncbi:hypothetical protein ACET3X_002019 [Alternaria dauci]|uniref:Metalloendopeptidase n=1 Tax=Alternaria dauci TaxID=48095 RepID=A0ABR3UZB7_9PLEO
MIIFFFLQLAALAVAVAINDPALNYGPFCGTPSPVYDNGTKATNWAEYFEELEKTSGQNGQGATDAWDAKPGPIPWPRNSENKVVIPYCFTQEWDRRNIRHITESGMDKWIEYLGGTAGADSGHAISFQERLDSQGNPMYCAPVKKYRDGWNAGIPYDTVAIEFMDGGGWGGSVGLTRNGKPWQNLVRLSDGFTLGGVLHELGHALGQAHEHNRVDRDTYVKIQYKQLVDWEDCWARARHKEGDRVTEDGLCSSMYRALKYQCTCASFIKNMVEPGWPIKADSGYDLESIMHYPSMSGYAKPDCNNDGEDCPVQQYMDWNDHEQGTTLLNRATKPSQMDIMWVKRNYPWHVES